jgi:hypothetical protein
MLREETMAETDVITVAEAARRLGLVQGESVGAEKRATRRLRAMMKAVTDPDLCPFIPGPTELTTLAAIKRACPQFRALRGESVGSIRRVAGELRELVDDRIDATLGHRFGAVRDTLEEMRSIIQSQARRIAELERA